MKSYRFSRSLGVLPVGGYRGFARQMVYEEHPVAEIEHPSPSPKAKSGPVEFSALPSAPIDHMGGGKIRVAESFNTSVRYGNRSVVGAVVHQDTPKLRVLCEPCGNEQLMGWSAWRGAVADLAGECRPCALRRMHKNLGRPGGMRTRPPT